MDEENKNERKPPVKHESKIYAFIAIGLAAAGAVTLGLSFTKLGVYSLIASMLFEIVAITFINLQKKKNDFKWLVYVKAVSYALFIASVFLFAGGTVLSSQQ